MDFGRQRSFILELYCFLFFLRWDLISWHMLWCFFCLMGLHQQNGWECPTGKSLGMAAMAMAAMALAVFSFSLSFSFSISIKNSEKNENDCPSNGKNQQCLLSSSSSSSSASVVWASTFGSCLTCPQSSIFLPLQDSRHGRQSTKGDLRRSMAGHQLHEPHKHGILWPLPSKIRESWATVSFKPNILQTNIEKRKQQPRYFTPI